MRRANNDTFQPNSKELCMGPNKRPDTKEEYEGWKRTWDSGTWVKTEDGKSPYTRK